MPRLWTANKSYTDSLNANNRYLVGASNGACNYQTIPEGSTKRVLHGAASGACYYGNETVPVPDMKGNITGLPSNVTNLSCETYLFGGTSTRTYLRMDNVSYNSSLMCYEGSFGSHPASPSTRARNYFTFNGAPSQAQQNSVQLIRRFELWQYIDSAWIKVSENTMTGGWTFSSLSLANPTATNTNYGSITGYQAVDRKATSFRIVPFTS